MKTLKLFLLILTFGLTTISCSKEKAPKLKTVEVMIEGMTCEQGCARLIRSKVAKEVGVQYAAVSFKAKKGVFTYDASKTSKENIIKKINSIADGSLYKVVSQKELDTIYTKNQSFKKAPPVD